jgi:hypothetical protein
MCARVYPCLCVCDGKSSGLEQGAMRLRARVPLPSLCFFLPRRSVLHTTAHECSADGAACCHMRRTNSRVTELRFHGVRLWCMAREDGRRDRPVRQHVAADSGKARRRVAPERLCLLLPPPPGTFCRLVADGRLRLAVLPAVLPPVLACRACVSSSLPHRIVCTTQQVHQQAFLCMRVVLLRNSARNLVSLWPIIMSEVTRILKLAIAASHRQRLVSTHRDRDWVLVDARTGHATPAPLPSSALGSAPFVTGGGAAGNGEAEVCERAFAALELIDLALVLQPEQVQLMQWALVQKPSPSPASHPPNLEFVGGGGERRGGGALMPVTPADQEYGLGRHQYNVKEYPFTPLVQSLAVGFEVGLHAVLGHARVHAVATRPGEHHTVAPLNGHTRAGSGGSGDEEAQRTLDMLLNHLIQSRAPERRGKASTGRASQRRPVLGRVSAEEAGELAVAAALVQLNAQRHRSKEVDEASIVQDMLHTSFDDVECRRTRLFSLLAAAPWCGATSSGEGEGEGTRTGEASGEDANGRRNGGEPHLKVTATGAAGACAQVPLASTSTVAAAKRRCPSGPIPSCSRCVVRERCVKVERTYCDYLNSCYRTRKRVRARWSSKRSRRRRWRSKVRSRRCRSNARGPPRRRRKCSKARVPWPGRRRRSEARVSVVSSCLTTLLVAFCLIVGGCARTCDGDEFGCKCK